MTALRFNLTEMEEDGVVLLTTRALSVWFDERPIWPVRGDREAALEIQIDDLLSHLSEVWQPLMLRQTYPLALAPTRPRDLRAAALNRWIELPAEQAVREDESLEAFRNAHDLSRAFAGYFDLPSLWLVRSGPMFLIDSDDGLERAKFAEVRRGLDEVGDQIAAILRATTDPRWSALLGAWARRDEGDGLRLLAWTTNLGDALARYLVGRGLLSEPATVVDAANDDDELRIAARMASALAPDQVEWVLSRVRQFPRQPAPALRQMAIAVREAVAPALGRAWPFEQGEMLAQAAREHLRLHPSAEVDVWAVLVRLGVTVELEDVDTRALDALAVWGKQHGPSVLLNRRSERHANRPNLERTGQGRATLAHELGHLLIDAEHALSVVDVLNSHMPLEVEQRARAFAGEFLLPARAAAEIWAAAGRPRGSRELRVVVESLRRRYTVTQSVAAWKLEHGARAEQVDLGLVLQSIVPQR